MIRTASDSFKNVILKAVFVPDMHVKSANFNPYNSIISTYGHFFLIAHVDRVCINMLLKFYEIPKKMSLRANYLNGRLISSLFY